MFFRIVIACIVVAASYALFQIYKTHSYYDSIRSPLAEFSVRAGTGNQSGITIVEFMNYDCGWCKDTHLALLDFAKHNPDITLVVRAAPFENGTAETAAERVLAAGLQGKFWEMDRALAEYKGAMDEKFFRESAAVYDIDYDRMVSDADGAEVQELAKDNASAVIAAGIQTTPALMVGKTIYQPDKALTLGDIIRMVEAEKKK